MEIIETSIFTRQISELLSDTEYKQLQKELVLNPLSGSVITGTGGLRKKRFKAEGRGRRGGIRVIYYFISKDDKIYMLLAYPKNKKDDLTADEKKTLRQIVERGL